MDKAIALLSGGIDSPVAIHMMQDRVEIIAVHFHQKPLTDGSEIEKCKELMKVLKVTKLYLVPFAEVLKTIVEKCEHKNYYILQKITMMKAAEILAKKEGATYLITGENLAQVSSQTLSNLANITKNIKLEIFRPVLTFDKQEIIDRAKKIGTYDISSGPEMCNLLGPKHPATRSELEMVQKELSNLDLLGILEEALGKAEVISQ
jgi:tRNA uracil 4-sulfurtransferase